MSEASHRLLDHFLNVTKTNEFCVYFNIGRPLVMQFLKWIISSNGVPPKEIMDMVRAMASAHSKPLELTMFSSIPDPSLQKISTEQVCQVDRTSSLLRRMQRKILACVSSLILPSVFDKVLWHQSTGSVLADCFQLHTSRYCCHAGHRNPCVFEVHIFFHSIATVEAAIYEKALKCFRL